MADDLAAFWVHAVSIERYAGAGAYGDTWAAPVSVTGFVDDGAHLVRNAQGQEVTSSAVVYLPAATTDVPLGSKVTLPAVFGSRSSRVVAVSRRDAGSLPLPAHLELHLL